MQDGKNNRAKASRKAHQAPRRFVSDATISFVHHIRSQSADGFLLVFADALESGVSFQTKHSMECLVNRS